VVGVRFPGTRNRGEGDMSNAHTHVHDDGDVKFAVLCMQYPNGWIIELQQLDGQGRSVGPSWRDADHTYKTLDDAKTVGVEIGLSKYATSRL